MKQCLVTIESISAYGQSRFHNTEKMEKEAHDDYEKRTWKERGHYTDKGHMYIPPMAFKNCLSEAAKYLSMPIPGKGKSTYTKNFVSGVMVMDPVILNETRETIKGLWLHVPSDGMRGGTKRVMKCFPYVDHWKGDVLFYIYDETITEEVFAYHLEQAGKFIGIGFFRPKNNGYWGRFKIASTILFEKEI